MKKDKKLIAKIILELKEHPHSDSYLSIQGYDNETIEYHALLLIEDGLASGTKHPITFESRNYSATVTHLTFKGYKVANSIKFRVKSLLAKIIG